jgi:hypothetical protein
MTIERGGIYGADGNEKGRAINKSLIDDQRGHLWRRWHLWCEACSADERASAKSGAAYQSDAIQPWISLRSFGLHADLIQSVWYRCSTTIGINAPPRCAGPR